jgi:threonine synthase
MCKELGIKAIAMPTAGNAGGAWASYARRAGIEAHIAMPKDAPAMAMKECLATGAHVYLVDGLISDAGKLIGTAAKHFGGFDAATLKEPYRIEGKKTMGLELAEQLNWELPDVVVYPTGGGVGLIGMVKAFDELEAIGWIGKKRPRMISVQAEGCAPIVNKLNQQSTPTCSPSTRALAILVGEPLQSDLAIKTIKESDGLALTVSDPDIFNAELQIAKLEGVFAEPASSAAVAALTKLKINKISKDDSVVCLITGSGLKATDVLQALTKKQKTAGLGTAVSTKQKILKVLSVQDAYGYDLWKQLGRTMTRGAVYQHLKELSDRGLVISYEEGGKRFFRITERGRKVLAAFDEISLLV